LFRLNFIDPCEKRLLADAKSENQNVKRHHCTP
jgi:hypothetical protein